MPVREASALGLKGFDEGSHKACEPDIPRAREVILDIRLTSPSVGAIILPLAQEDAPSPEQVHVRKRI